MGFKFPPALRATILFTALVVPMVADESTIFVPTDDKLAIREAQLQVIQLEAQLAEPLQRLEEARQVLQDLIQGTASRHLPADADLEEWQFTGKLDLQRKEPPEATPAEAP